MSPRPLSGDLIQCPAIQLGMWAHSIVVFPPVSQNLPGIIWALLSRKEIYRPAGVSVSVG
ncbi:MAG: hypothetical protein SOI54_09935 [Acetobacter sp.]